MIVQSPEIMGYVLAGKAKKKKGQFLPGLTQKKRLKKNVQKAARAGLAVKTLGLSEIAIRNNPDLRKTFAVGRREGEIMPGLFKPKLLAKNLNKAGKAVGGFVGRMRTPEVEALPPEELQKEEAAPAPESSPMRKILPLAALAIPFLMGE